MALPATVYKATIQLADVDRGVYETLATTIAQHPSETAERLVARLLAYAIFHEPGLNFSKGLCANDEPDLWRKSGDGRVSLWVEVGLPEAERIIKACRHSQRVAMLACGRALLNWDQQQLPKLAGLDNLTVISIDPAVIVRLAMGLERSINWELTITSGAIYLTTGAETLEATIQIKIGSL